MSSLRKALVLVAIMGGCLAAAALLVSNGNSFLAKMVRTHTPQLAVQAPVHLSQEPIAGFFPAHRYWLWLPGSGFLGERRLLKKYPEIYAVRFEKDFERNRISVVLEPRKPLVNWNNSGVDGEGKVFPLEASQPVLPRATILRPQSLSRIGPWLEAVSRSSEIWPLVSDVGEMDYGDVFLDLKTGTRVIWGAPEKTSAGGKLQVLSRVLEDAHQRLGGISLADLRFFSEGRITVKPKGIN
jgi:hypothetical protein